MKGRHPEKLNRPDVSHEKEELRVYPGSSKKGMGDTQAFHPVKGDTVSFPAFGKSGETKAFPLPEKQGSQAKKGDTRVLPNLPGQSASAKKGDTVAFSPLSSGRSESGMQRGDTGVFQPVRGKKSQADLNSQGEKASQAHQESKKASGAAQPTQYSPQQLLTKYRSGLFLQYIRLYLLALVALLSIFLLIYQRFSFDFLPGLEKHGPFISLLGLILALILGIEVPIHGIFDLLRARISTYTLTTFAALLAVIHGISSLSANVQTYCLPLLLLVFFQEYSLVSYRSGMFHTLHTVCSFDAPMGIYDSPKLLPNTDSLHRSPGDLKKYVQDLLQADLPQKVFCCYSTALLPVTILLAVLFAVRTGANFLLLWLLLLSCSIPATGMLAYALPMRSLAKTLAKHGGALCGWHSAKLFGGKHTLILRDEDLFPRGDYGSNGMKLFHGYRAEDVIPLALATAELVDSPLTDLLRSLLTAPVRKPLRVTDSKIYDNNGIGAEVNGDVVLVGTLSFMRSMGVHMPAGTRVRQAVHVSINGELAGIIAVRYKPNPSTGAGLKEVLSNRNFTVVLATRDFLITPELIAAKYELPVDALVYPSYTERLRLSEKDDGEISSQGALIAKDTFGAFAMTVSAGRTLRLAGRTGMWMNLISGFLGLVLCILLILWGAISSVTPVHLAAFHLIWAGVTLLISQALIKF